jgi:citrate synthase
MTQEHVRTRIWLEEPEADNPYATRAAYCHGYDVFGDMLGHASWAEMLYLLLRGERPSRPHTLLLEALAVALANPGPRDASVHAAMCAGVCGSTAASTLMAALAVGAGRLGGGRDVLLAMETWTEFGTDLGAWRARLATPAPSMASIWPGAEHPPGFDPHGVTTATTVMQTLACLASTGVGAHCEWLAEHRVGLEEAARCPIGMTAVAAAAFMDLGLSPAQGEMLFLLMRLPGAAAHALEQREYGYRNFPFFPVELQDDPASFATPSLQPVKSAS